jgi:glycosidase
MKRLTNFLIIILLGLWTISCNQTPKPEVVTEVKKDSIPDSLPVVTVKHPDWSLNANIYEVNIRQYTKEGTFKAFTNHLARLKEMGVDILWLMPIHPIGEKNRKGKLGSAYSVKDYLAVNPAYGTIEDLKALVSKAHELGMYVILDWVANHTAWDNPLIEQHPDWYTKDQSGNIVAPVADWTDVADLNYDNQDLRKYMIDALKFWIQNADIDGYRCDVAGMVPVDFWQNARTELDKIKPVFMLAEADQPELHKAFDMTYGWKLHSLMNKVAQGKNDVKSIDSLFAADSKDFKKDDIRMNFTSNHDENSWNGTEYERMGAGVLTFAVLAATVPGMPLIYTGQEVSLNKKLKFFEKDEINWKGKSLADFYKKLLVLKKDNKALWNGEAGGDYKRIPTSHDEIVFAFVRSVENKKIFVVLNCSKHETEITFLDKDFTGPYTEIFTNENASLTQDEKMVLKPWEYRVYVK